MAPFSLPTTSWNVENVVMEIFINFVPENIIFNSIFLLLLALALLVVLKVQNINFFQEDWDIVWELGTFGIRRG